MVVDHQPEAWNRALVRARARGIEVVQSRVERGGDVQYWRASSHSRLGAIHSVRVDCSAVGIQVDCDCEGGQSGRICQHVAAVLRVAGLLPDAVLVMQAEAPSDAPKRSAKPKRTGLLAWQEEDEADARAAWGEPFGDLILPE